MLNAKELQQVLKLLMTIASGSDEVHLALPIYAEGKGVS